MSAEKNADFTQVRHLKNADLIKVIKKCRLNIKKKLIKKMQTRLTFGISGKARSEERMCSFLWGAGERGHWEERQKSVCTRPEVQPVTSHWCNKKNKKYIKQNNILTTIIIYVYAILISNNINV